MAQRLEAPRSDGRASFWLSSVVVPSDTHSDESPIGPSVGEVSDWTITCRPSRSMTSSDTVSTKCWKPSPSSRSLSSLVA